MMLSKEIITTESAGVIPNWQKSIHKKTRLFRYLNTDWHALKNNK